MATPTSTTPSTPGRDPEDAPLTVEQIATIDVPGMKDLEPFDRQAFLRQASNAFVPFLLGTKFLEKSTQEAAQFIHEHRNEPDVVTGWFVEFRSARDWFSGHTAIMDCVLARLTAAAARVAVAAPEVPPPPHEDMDGALIRHCANCVALEDARHGEEGGEAEASYLASIDFVTQTTAVTERGNRAKLAVALAFFQPDLPEVGTLATPLMWDGIKALALSPQELASYGDAT